MLKFCTVYLTCYINSEERCTHKGHVYCIVPPKILLHSPPLSHTVKTLNLI
jgi:hypothetical protein